MITRGVRTILFTFSLALVCTAMTLAQNLGPVTIDLRQPPPNQVKVSDLWAVTIINTGRTALNVYLRGTISSPNNTLLTSTSSAFVLPPGTKVFSGNNMVGLSPVSTTYTDNHFKDILTNVGNAPSGEYALKVEVWPTSFAPTSAPGPIASSSVDQTVESVSQPLLVSPGDGTDVQDLLPIFTWAMPAPLQARAKVVYTIRIVQLLGKQTSVAAMQANPAWYEHGSIGTTTMQYPPGSRSLVAGAHYAWKVSAFSFGALLGESEVWEFTYAPISPAISAMPQPGAVINRLKALDVLDELLQSCTEDMTVKKSPAK